MCIIMIYKLYYHVDDVEVAGTKEMVSVSGFAIVLVLKKAVEHFRADDVHLFQNK